MIERGAYVRYIGDNRLAFIFGDEYLVLNVDGILIQVADKNHYAGRVWWYLDEFAPLEGKIVNRYEEGIL